MHGRMTGRDFAIGAALAAVVVGGLSGVALRLLAGAPAAAIAPAERAVPASAPWRPTRNTIRLDQPMSAEELDRQQPGSGVKATRPVRVSAPASAGATWSYPGCREARAAGAAPLYAGQPGYGPHMDGDNDGIACEPYHGG